VRGGSADHLYTVNLSELLYTVKIGTPVKGQKEAGAGTRYHHGDLRRALLNSALAILEAGEELSLRAVARRAGVSHTAPYHHFRDRRALVAAVAQEGFLGLRGALASAGEGDDAQGRLLESGVAYVRFAAANPTRFRLMFSAELAERADLPELQAASDAAYGELLTNVRRLMGGAAAEEAVQTRALAAWSTVHGLAMLILDRQVPGVEADVEDAVRAARRVLGGPPG
jgi:AcrR family transcriptional regulator